jgi:hypothetical protein
LRILVTGDRNWRNFEVVAARLEEIVEEYWRENDGADGVTIIHGDARGADTCADHAAQLLDLSIERYPALWNEHGRAAGSIRNQQMLDSGVDYVVGFHNNILESRGTRDMLRRCIRASIPGTLFTETEEVTEWQNLLR